MLVHCFLGTLNKSDSLDTSILLYYEPRRRYLRYGAELDIYALCTELKALEGYREFHYLKLSIVYMNAQILLLFSDVFQ